jgi:hypothetical protein
MITRENAVHALAHVWATEEEHEIRSYQQLLDASGIQSDLAMLQAIADIARRILEERPDISSMPDVTAGYALALGIAVGVQAAHEETRGDDA